MAKILELKFLFSQACVTRLHIDIELDVLEEAGSHSSCNYCYYNWPKKYENAYMGIPFRITYELQVCRSGLLQMVLPLLLRISFRSGR